MSLDAVEYRDEAGHDIVLPTTMRYSTGTPCLELILEVPGSVWVRNESSNLHHIGFWSDSMPAQSDAFSAAGCPLQLCGRAGDDRTDVVRVPPGQRTRDPHGTRRRVHARRHAVPLRAPTARRLTRGVLPAQRTEPLPAVPGVPPIMFIMLSQHRNSEERQPPDPAHAPSSGTAARGNEETADRRPPKCAAGRATPWVDARSRLVGSADVDGCPVVRCPAPAVLRSGISPPRPARRQIHGPPDQARPFDASWGAWRASAGARVRC